MKGIGKKTWANCSALLLVASAASAQCEVAEFSALDAQASDYFGSAVAIHGQRALVGAVAAETGGAERGAAYVFERGTGGWSAVAKLLGSDSAHNDGFGSELDIDGERIISEHLGTTTSGKVRARLMYSSARWVAGSKRQS